MHVRVEAGKPIQGCKCGKAARPPLRPTKCQGRPQLSPVIRTAHVCCVECSPNREALLSTLCVDSLFKSSPGLYGGRRTY